MIYKQGNVVSIKPSGFSLLTNEARYPLGRPRVCLDIVKSHNPEMYVNYYADHYTIQNPNSYSSSINQLLHIPTVVTVWYKNVVRELTYQQHYLVSVYLRH